MAGSDKSIWIIANWKSNKTIAETLDWVSSVGSKLPKREDLKVVVCPTFSALSEVKKAITVGNFPIMVGSQDLSPFEAGAYTGEESASLLKELVELSIIGHSERRKNFSETDEMISKKVKRANEAGITPLVCVQDEETPVPEECKMIAYDPIWAISTGLTNTPGVGRADTPEDANKLAIRFKQKYGKELEVIYGGSVTATNVKGFIIQSDIDGVLVGNASLDAEEFIKILKACKE